MTRSEQRAADGMPIAAGRRPCGAAGGASLIALLLAAAPAQAGPPDEVVRAVQTAAGMGELAPGAIRFTAVQPGGRGATVYEARRGSDGISRTIVDLSPAAGGAWAVDGRETKPMAAETLDYFTGRIDAAIAAALSDTPCEDGPAYRAEHGPAGANGCAPDSANAAIARALGLADPVAP